MLCQPEFSPALQVLPHDLSCYFIDDEYTFSTVESPIDPCERALIGQVDQVFVHSPAMMDKKGGLNPHTAEVPNGVDYASFAQPFAEPDDMKAIPHPRIGYAGYIKKQLDFDLLIELAGLHPEWSFVMVGPTGYLGSDQPKVAAFADMPNVYFLGSKGADRLPAYLQHMDVCTMCYRIDDYTKYIYPLKLHEYLACGRPIIAPPLRSLRAFSSHIKLVSTADEWSQAIAASLEPAAQSANSVGARREVAREYDWNRLAGQVARQFCRRLGDAYSARFRSLSAR